MAGDPSSWDWIVKAFRSVLQVFSLQEVKTPLSFFFRIGFYITLLIALALLFTPSGDPLRTWLIKFLIGTLAFMFFAVCIFAWAKPRNLVYGESGHRAERKMTLEYGSEGHSLTPAELDALPHVENPKLLKEGDGQ